MAIKNTHPWPTNDNVYIGPDNLHCRIIEINNGEHKLEVVRATDRTQTNLRWVSSNEFINTYRAA